MLKIPLRPLETRSVDGFDIFLKKLLFRYMKDSILNQGKVDHKATFTFTHEKNIQKINK